MVQLAALLCFVYAGSELTCTASIARLHLAWSIVDAVYVTDYVLAGVTCLWENTWLTKQGTASWEALVRLHLWFAQIG